MLETLLPEYEYPTLTGWSRKINASIGVSMMKDCTWTLIFPSIDEGPSFHEQDPVKLEHPGATIEPQHPLGHS